MTREQFIDINQNMSNSQLAGMLYDTITKYEKIINESCEDCVYYSVDCIFDCCISMLDCKRRKNMNDRFERNDK